MKKLWMITFIVLLSAAIAGAGQLFAEDDTDVHKQDVELNEEQKAELEELHTELFAIHKKILEKYGEYGVLSDEKVKAKFEHMEEYHKKLKEKGYIPDWHHKKGKNKMKEKER